MFSLLWFHRRLYRCLSAPIVDYVAQLCISLLIFCRRQWHPTLVLLPDKSHGWRSLAGCSPWGREELDMTERLQFHFSLSCTGEGNGNPLQCSCLENPRDGEPGGLPSLGSYRVRHDWSDLAAAAAEYYSAIERERRYLATPWMSFQNRLSGRSQSQNATS